jgi:integrase
VGRAQGFPNKSQNGYLAKYMTSKLYVAKLSVDRASDSGSEGRGFKSLHVRLRFSATITTVEPLYSPVRWFFSAGVFISFYLFLLVFICFALEFGYLIGYPKIVDLLLRALETANQKLAGTGVSIYHRKQKNTLNLRAVLPPKGGSNKRSPYRQVILLKNPITGKGLQMSGATIAHALKEARRLWSALDEGTFRWVDWLDEEAAAGLTLVQLWDRWMEEKKQVLEETTLKKDYQRFRNHLIAMGDRYPEDGVLVKDWMLANLSAKSAKKMLQFVRGCCRWAVERNLIEKHNFETLAETIRDRKSSSQEIDPFSLQEVEKIIKAFEANMYYKHYTPFVKFLFLTGCRTSEAVGLLWENVFDDVIVFSKAYVSGTWKGTKTGKVRRFEMGESLKVLMEEIKASQCDRPTDHVFQSPKGGLIDSHNFLPRAWRTVLSEAGVRYRKQYQTRHTFISFAISEGMLVPEIAEWVGNSSEIIYRHYAGVFQKHKVPEMFGVKNYGVGTPACLASEKQQVESETQ